MNACEVVVKTAAKIVDNNAIYLWGAQGEKVKKLTLEDIRRMETNEANAKAVFERIQMLDSLGLLNSKNRAFDCSGLLCWLLIKAGIEKAGFDLCADALFERYKKTPILKIGCILHRKGHVGLYVGNNYLIEAKGRKYGVCISPFVVTDWERVYAYPYE